jgi:hypothetical protein
MSQWNPQHHCFVYCHTLISVFAGWKEKANTSTVRIWHQVSGIVVQPPQRLLKSPTHLRRGLSCYNIWLSNVSNLLPSWMNLHNCRFIQEHPRMLLQWGSTLHSYKGVWKHPNSPRTTSEIDWSIWNICIKDVDQGTSSEGISAEYSMCEDILTEICSLDSRGFHNMPYKHSLGCTECRQR